jgi:type I restriction enzyme S subunit
LCPEDSVIIGRKGNINNPIFMDTKFWNVDTAFGIAPLKEFLLPKFLYYFCIIFNFEKYNKAVTIPSLTKSDLKQIVYPCSPSPYPASDSFAS